METKCEECKEIKECEFVPDPYMEKYYSDHTEKWLCARCVERLSDDNLNNTNVRVR